MIAQFPTPYPDELLYSQICRYHIRSGNYCATFTVDDIYHHRTVHPDFLYLNAFTDDALRWICKDTTLQEVIMTRTMFPVYGRFIPKDRREKAFSMLCAMEGNWDNLLFAPIKRGDRFLRYCPMCAAEDRTAYGETYWHRNAQICKLNICPEHGCKLVDSNVRISSRTTPNFFDAQSIIPVDTEAVMCENAAEIQLAQYMDAVMRSPLDPDTDTPVGSFLHSKLGEKYCNRSGLVRDMEQLYADYAAYYDGVELIMEKRIYDKKTGIHYELQGDYYLPCLTLPEQPKVEIGIWGKRHLRYIKQHHKIRYTNLLTSCKLTAYLADIDKQAEEMFFRLVKQLAEKEGVTEQLKADDQMLWVKRMNNIRNRATEIVNAELIYC